MKGCWLRVGVALLVLASATAALADRAEAQWGARAVAGVARLQSEHSLEPAYGAVGGFALSAAYGLSNQLEVGIELVSLITSAPRFEHAQLMVSDDRLASSYQRREGSVLALLGASWRLGVSWVPVLAGSAGLGVRLRDHGEFVTYQYQPVEDRATWELEFALGGKVSLERRVNQSLTVGAYSSVQLGWGPEAPLLGSLAFSLGVSYVHYPLW